MSKYIRYVLLSVVFVLSLLCCLKVSFAGEAEKHYEAGLEQYKKGWYDQAIGEFEKAITLNQDYVSAYYALGNAYYCKHLYDKAIKEYHKVLRYAPEHAKAHYALWLCYRALGMTGDAERELEIYKKLSGQKTEQKDASYSSDYSEKKDSTRSEERTTSWHVAESQTPVPSETPPKSAKPKETKKQETPPAPQKQPEEAVKKHGETLSYSQMLAQLEQKQKEPVSTTPAVPTAPHEQPAKAKEGEKEAVETHKQAEALDTHTTQPVVHKQPSIPVAANAEVKEETTSQPLPPPVKAEEQVQSPPSHQPVQTETVETKAPVLNESGTAPVEVKKPRIVVEKPLVSRPSIKVRLEYLWKEAPMGKVIVSIMIYVFAAQVWIATVAMLGLFFCKRR